MQSKKIILAVSTAILMSSPFIVVPLAYAQDTNTTHTNFFQGLIQMIAQKFGLDKNQVQSVVNDYKQGQKQNMQQNMQNREKARLDKLVKAGKITGDQETAILNELAVLRAKYNPADMKNETPDQRKTQAQSMQAEFKSWAQSQGIDPNIVGAFGMGKGMMGRRGQRPSWSPSPAATP